MDFSPPKHELFIEDVLNIIDKAYKLQILDTSILESFLKVNILDIKEKNLGQIVFAVTKAYFEKIPGNNVPNFLIAYITSIDNNMTKYLIMVCLYFAAKQRYPEMIANFKFITESQMLASLQQFDNYLATKSNLLLGTDSLMLD